MAVVKMKKFLIASHQSDAAVLLESLQGEGICQLLNSDQAMVTKEFPELTVSAKRPKEIEDLLGRLLKCISFLKNYAKPAAGLGSALAPLREIDRKTYDEIVSDEKFNESVEEVLSVGLGIENTSSKIENLNGSLAQLQLWKALQTPVEEISELENSTCLAGLLPSQKFEEIRGGLDEFDTAVELVAEADGKTACLIVCLNANLNEVQKLLRSVDFEAANFDAMHGTPAELIADYNKKLGEANEQLQNQLETAKYLSENLGRFEILYDHYNNLLTREQTRTQSAATEKVIVFEGWVKKHDYKRLEKIVAGFSASNLNGVTVGEDEQPPIEIENNAAVKPFETITRLHGMPNVGDVDPTAFLAPFFALFFGICLTDAAYGIIIMAFSWWLIKKFQGDKKAFWMLLICSIFTVVAGALTGGWFGDAFQSLIPQSSPAYGAINGVREKIMLFDPMKEPMTFFVISIGLGYVQIMFALFIGLFNNIIRKDYATAVFNFLVWIIFLNSLAVFGWSKYAQMPTVATIVGWLAVLGAVLIFLFTERKSGMAARFGSGFFSLFSTVFYFGDILSYVRLMALGMVTAGLGMAVNILVKLLMDIPYVGFILGALLFVGGHLLNLALSVLSSFVHSLRLQFVEFFPKFFTGGGEEFKPLALCNKYFLMKEKKAASE